MAEPTQRSQPLRDVAFQAGVVFVGTALVPRLSYWVRWPTRLGPRGFTTYVVFNTLFLFGVRTWVIPRLKEMAQEHERTKEELRRQLGREPTDDELFAHRWPSED